MWAKLKGRLKRLTLVESLLIAILLSSLVNGSKESDIDKSLHTVGDSLVDVQNEVRSNSENLQSKLDDLKEALEQIAANQ